MTENKDKVFIFVFVIAIGLPLAFLGAYFLAFKNRVYPQVQICQTALTGKTLAETEQILNQNLKEKVPEKIILTFEEQSYPLIIKSLRYTPQTTAQKAFRLGREGNFISRAKKLVQLFKQGEERTYDYQLNQEGFDQEITNLTGRFYQSAVNPEIKISDRKIMVEVGKNGREIDLRQLKKDISQALACPQKEIIVALPIIEIAPQITNEAAENTRARAEKLLGKQVILKQEDRSWKITDEEIVSLLSFAGGFDRSKISEYVRHLIEAVNTSAENATFKFENNRVSLFRPSKVGIVVEETNLTEKLEKTLMALENSPGEIELEIPVVKIAPKIATSDVNSLGINELLGKGTSVYRGSIDNRIHNLNLASLRLNGILVAPGEEFSFNKNLGDVSADTGYKQAYVIKDGRTILGDGGGVCQVSTTLFRAVLNAGLSITQRQAHAYRVSYYEQDLGPGFDATVFLPSPDFRFKNNTEAYLLVQSKNDPKTMTLIFEIYGTSDGRKAEISAARIWDRQPPPPDLYQDDPTLKKGALKQIEHKAWGAKVAFDYKVTRGSETLENKTFYSYYRPWQAVYLRGTGE